MASEDSAPPFDSFLRWVASRSGSYREEVLPSDRVLAAARVAHGELGAPGARRRAALPSGPLARRGVEVLELLVASSRDAARPPEVVTATGFRVGLDSREDPDTGLTSACVRVQCPEQSRAAVQGQIAYLWHGPDRFELGEFDADGKAIGTLPQGLDITLADFEAGRIKLEVAARGPERPG